MFPNVKMLHFIVSRQNDASMYPSQHSVWCPVLVGYVSSPASLRTGPLRVCVCVCACACACVVGVTHECIHELSFMVFFFCLFLLLLLLLLFLFVIFVVHYVK